MFLPRQGCLVISAAFTAFLLSSFSFHFKPIAFIVYSPYCMHESVCGPTSRPFSGKRYSTGTPNMPCPVKERCFSRWKLAMSLEYRTQMWECSVPVSSFIVCRLHLLASVLHTISHALRMKPRIISINNGYAVHGNLGRDQTTREA